MRDYRIVAGTTLTVDYHDIKIEVDLPSGKTYEFGVDPYDKLSVLQDFIKQKEGIEKTKYDLFHMDMIVTLTETFKNSGIN
jgi:hypothetical protein